MSVLHRLSITYSMTIIPQIQFSPTLLKPLYLIIIIMYIYHALINALSAHMIHINLNMIFATHVEHSPIKSVYIKYYFILYI